MQICLCALNPLHCCPEMIYETQWPSCPTPTTPTTHALCCAARPPLSLLSWHLLRLRAANLSKHRVSFVDAHVGGSRYWIVVIFLGWSNSPELASTAIRCYFKDEFEELLGAKFGNDKTQRRQTEEGKMQNRHMSICMCVCVCRTHTNAIVHKFTHTYTRTYAQTHTHLQTCNLYIVS